MSKPSAGALRAAKEVMALERDVEVHELWEADYYVEAEIIDRETGLPELLEALKTIDRITTTAQHDPTVVVQAIARAAIAKAKGEEDV